MALDKLEKSVTTENNQFRSTHSSGERCGGGYLSGWIAIQSPGGETANSNSDARAPQNPSHRSLKPGYFKPSMFLAITWHVATRSVIELSGSAR